MRSAKLIGIAVAAWCCALTFETVAQAEDVRPVKWSTGWNDNEFLLKGHIADDSEAEDFWLFLARCEPGKPGLHLWFFADYAEFPGQVVSDEGMRSVYKPRSAAVVVDGVSHELKDTTLTPEEAWGGHEMTLDVARDTPLLKVLRNGRTMAVKVDDLTLPSVSLAGASKSFDTFTRKCAGAAKAR